MRAVIDTCVSVSAFIGRSNGAPSQVLRAAEGRWFEIIASPQLIGELTRVLARSKFDRWAGESNAADFVGGLSALSTQYDDPSSPAAFTRDSKDDYLVAIAHISNADVIVSFDRDLLDADLVAIRCLTPAEFLAVLEAPQDPA